jgi:hypothetical protein
MKILVLTRSSSIKYQLNIDKKEFWQKELLKIGLMGAFIKNERNDGDTMRLKAKLLTIRRN